MGKNLTKTTLVEKYLNGEEGRKVALAYATAVLKTDYEQIPYRLKQAIKSYVAKDREDFISCIKVNSIYKFYDNISKFPLNEIRYLPPHYIQANDYKEIQACIKNPIDVKRCSFEGVTADLSLIKQGYFDKYA